MDNTNREECLVDGASHIVQMIMTQHWDLAACPCWVCNAGRVAGLHPTSDFLDYQRHGYGTVKVYDTVTEWKTNEVTVTMETFPFVSQRSLSYKKAFGLK